ncbi:hypothetical protein BpHYR1_010883 [Brachionus plicatilis]|uniref:Uncharacterized protein n=1 Tax=Brachionus plicatilis TaxID=10195 RepID=A0A3M7PWT4_BRAPC|nr:hypothetical protein BpHYR1_010883 [Brachionus plicatilis]
MENSSWFTQLTSYERFDFIIADVKRIKLPRNLITLTAMLIFTSLFHINVLFAYDVDKVNTNSSTSYTITMTEFGYSKIGNSMFTAKSIIRGYVFFVILLVINIFTLIKFSIAMKKKKQITKSKAGSESNENKAKKNMSKMIIVKGLAYITGNLTNITAQLINSEVSTMSDGYKVFVTFSNIAWILAQGLDIFIYFKFNKVYRQILNSYFGKSVNCFKNLL